MTLNRSPLTRRAIEGHTHCPLQGAKGNQMSAPRLYRDESQDPKRNAQRNLDGRTHYVEDNTLSYHHSRILSARVIADGLYFGIVESVALDMHNRSRGYRHVVFNLFGNVVSRSDLEHCAKTSKKAYEALDEHRRTLESAMEDTVRFVLADLRKEKEAVASQYDYLAKEIIEKFEKATK